MATQPNFQPAQLQATPRREAPIAANYCLAMILAVIVIGAAPTRAQDGASIAVASPASPSALAITATGAATGGADTAAPVFQIVGQARLKVLLWSVYDSRLYTPTGKYEDGQRPLRLEIQYLRDIKADALVDRTLVEWEAMGRSHPRQGEWLATLRKIWPDIKTNDVLDLELDEDGVATFTHNGTVAGRIEDPAFGQQFVDIWLSRDCTRPELRLSLLGLNDS